MVTMPEELIHILRKWNTVPVATIGSDGKTNVAGKSVMVMDPETIVRSVAPLLRVPGTGW
jgi:hypothetical protein